MAPNLRFGFMAPDSRSTFTFITVFRRLTRVFRESKRNVLEASVIQWKFLVRGIISYTVIESVLTRSEECLRWLVLSSSWSRPCGTNHWGRRQRLQGMAQGWSPPVGMATACEGGSLSASRTRVRVREARTTLGAALGLCATNNCSYSAS